MVDRWVQDHQKDAWRKQAKASGYRARSAFKLKQTHERHKIFELGNSVLDVGCHPGGWAQVAVELVGSNGKVVGVDLKSCVPVEGANLIVETLLTLSLSKQFSMQSTQKSSML